MKLRPYPDDALHWKHKSQDEWDWEDSHICLRERKVLCATWKDWM